MRRKELTEHQWSKIAPLLPSHKHKKRGRPAKDHRDLLNAILWVLRTGAPWRDLPERYGPWQTAASRFYRWQKMGVWQRVLEELQKEKDRSREVEWEIHFLDSTSVRAHQHAAGAKGGSKSRL
jgi:transposase